MSRFSQEKHKLSIVETTGRRARSGNLWLCFHLENLGNLCSETTREELGVFDSQQQGLSCTCSYNSPVCRVWDGKGIVFQGSFPKHHPTNTMEDGKYCYLFFIHLKSSKK